MKCAMSTDGSFWMGGENRQCEHRGFYRLPMELAEYLPRILVCKKHLSPFLSSYNDWIKIFKQYNVPKGLDLKDLQQNYLQQSVFAELH